MGNLRSMTGYGRSTFCLGDYTFSVEVSSVNQRGLALSISAPSEWNIVAERFLSPVVREFATRGKIYLTIKPDVGIKKKSEDILNWDESAVSDLLGRLRESGKKNGVSDTFDFECFLKVVQLCQMKDASLPDINDESIQKKIIDGVRVALEAFIQMRKTEGVFLEKDLKARLQKLFRMVEEIKKVSQNTVVNYRDALLERLKKINLEWDINDERVIKEITIFADRCDNAEELTRLDSHFKQFIDTCDEKESGRKLDFICQEILRELNTIASKACNVEITRIVVDAKNEQERIREQVQNIE